jgi:hypothetical protein
MTYEPTRGLASAVQGEEPLGQSVGKRSPDFRGSGPGGSAIPRLRIGDTT